MCLINIFYLREIPIKMGYSSTPPNNLYTGHLYDVAGLLIVAMWHDPFMTLNRCYI